MIFTKIATGEIEGTRSSGRRNSGLAGAKAIAEALTAAERSKIAKAGAEARWRRKETVMSFEDKFSAAFEQGLADIKFCVRRTDNLSVDQLKADALAFREAIEVNNIKLVKGVD